MPISVDRTGLGGGARIQLACDGCTSSNLVFNTSTYVQDSRRHVASLSIALAFLLTGHVHSGYHKTLGRGIGIPALHRNTFYMVEKEAYPHIQRMLQSMCECAKEEMKAMGAEELRGWKNAVTTADGCWLTRGHFSQNFTFIIKTTKRIPFYGMATSVCVGVMMWLRSHCILAQQSQQRDTWPGSFSSRQRKKVARCQ